MSGSELDLAFIDLSSAIGDRTGYMGVDFDFASGSVHVTGYPSVYGRNEMDNVGAVHDHSVDWSPCMTTRRR